MTFYLLTRAKTGRELPHATEAMAKRAARHLGATGYTIERIEK